jgi:hypothetical protein
MMILDYIFKNKEWIFSGIGVTLLGLFFFLIKHFLSKKSPMIREEIKNIAETSTNLEPIKIIRSSAMSQEDVGRIMKELDDMPPLHIDDITKNYLGFDVNWLTRYSSASKDKDDLINVCLTIDLRHTVRPILIYCTVKLSDYRQFSILKSGAKVRVVGKIDKFDHYLHCCPAH